MHTTTPALTVETMSLLCKMIDLLVRLSWDTPHRTEACALAEQLFEALAE